jgi:WD40 repeat protein/predicted Ser/Thr protein kinase
MSGPECVSANDLRDYLLGELPEGVAQKVASHLKRCATCEERAQWLEQAIDPFFHVLRQALGKAADPNVTRTGIPPLSGDTTGEAATPSPGGPLPSVPGYEILGELGRGGMGVVYQARQISLNRTVALKMLLPGQLSSTGAVQRFRREAEAAAYLDHPNIVPIYEVSEHQGQYFFSMRLIDGVNLDHKAAELMKSPREAARLVASVARAVHYAHQRGILHRDLKPANILIDEDGRPHVTDFGLARRLERGGSLTQTGAIMGTPEYMSPEQATAQPGLTTAADVYSLGAILYTLLTGRPPFRGLNLLETLRQVVEQEPTPPRLLQPAVNKDLETICLKCLAKEPAQRYASAEALAGDLENWLEGRPIAARPASLMGRLRRWAKRRPAVAALLMVVVFLAVGGFATVYWQYQEALRQKSLAEEETGRKAAALIQAEQAELKAKDQTTLAQNKARETEDALKKETQAKELAAQRLDRARRNLMTAQLLRVSFIYERDPGQALDLLEDTNACPLDQRDFAWGMYYRWCQRDRPSFPGSPPAAVTRDGKTVVCSNYHWKGTVEIWDVATGKRTIRLPEKASAINVLALSPDGKLLAVGDEDSTVRLWEVATGKQHAALKGHTGGVASIAFTPDGQLLAAAARGKYDSGRKAFVNGEVKLWEVAARKEKATLKGHSSSVSSVAFSPDGKELALGSRNEIKLWDLASSKESRSFPAPPGGVSGMAFTPHAKTLVLGGVGFAGGVKLYDRTTGKERASFKGDSSFAISPDGRMLACGDASSYIKLWDLTTGKERVTLPSRGRPLAFTADGKTLFSIGDEVKRWDLFPNHPWHNLKGHEGAVTSVAFTPGGNLLVSGSSDRTVKVWDMTRSGERHTLSGHKGAVSSVAVRADGKVAASGSHDHTVKLWDLKARKELRTLAGHDDHVYAVAFAPEGKMLASAGRNGLLKLWEVDSGKELASLEGHDAPVYALAFAPDGKTLASGSDDGTVKLWDVDDWRAGKVNPRVRTLRGHAGEIYAVAFSPDGKTLASGSGGKEWFGEVKLWDAAAGQLRTTVKSHANFVIALAFSADGKTLASGSWDQTVKLWDAATGQERATLEGHEGAVLSVAFRGDSRMLAAACGGPDGQEKWPGEIKLWASSTSEERVSLRHTTTVLTAAFTQEGKTVTTVTEDGTVKVWETATGEVIESQTYPVSPRLAALSDDGKIFASVQGNSLLKLWDTNAAKELASVREPAGKAATFIRGLALSGDGKTLAALFSLPQEERKDGGLLGRRDPSVELKVWDAPGGKERTTLKTLDHWLDVLALTADGKVVAAHDTKGRLTLWATATGKESVKLEGNPGRVPSATFSSDGKLLAVGTVKGGVRLWDTSTGKERRSLKGHAARVTRVTFSADGTTLASVGGEWNGFEIKVWDVATGKELFSLKRESEYLGVALSPNGKVLASWRGFGKGKSVSLWDVPSPQK